jgi:hypothetical protein
MVHYPILLAIILALILPLKFMGARIKLLNKNVSLAIGKFRILAGLAFVLLIMNPSVGSAKDISGLTNVFPKITFQLDIQSSSPSGLNALLHSNNLGIDTIKPKKDTVVIKKIKEELKTQLIKTSELLGRIEDPSVTNFHSWRYAFMQSALPIKNQHVYYQNYNVAFNDFYMGVGDNMAIGVGYALPFFAYVNPKISLQLNKKPSLFGHAIAATNTTVFGFFTQSENQKWGNNLQVLYTLGNDFRNATIGLGYLTSSEIDGSSLMTNIGASWAVNSNFYVVGEVWLNNRERNIQGKYMTFEQATTGGWVPAPVINYNEMLKRNTLFTSIQFRLIGLKSRANAWSFGVSSYWEYGDRFERPVFDYEGVETTYTAGPGNKFLFLPSFTYTRKLGNRTVSNL